MRQALTLIFVILLYNLTNAQKYVHYYMNDGTYNGFYTSMYPEIRHDCSDQTAKITLNGIEHILSIENIEKIAVEDAIVHDGFDGDYRIYEETLENDIFKKIFVDNRACLFASKTGEFGANDTILYSSAYDNEKILFITDENKMIKNCFDGKSFFFFDYTNGGLSNIIKFENNNQSLHSEIIPLSSDLRTQSSLITKAPKVNVGSTMNFFQQLSTLGPIAEEAIGITIDKGVNLATNLTAVSENPELHNQLLIVDGLSIAADAAAIAASIALKAPVGGLTIGLLVLHLGSLYNDITQLMHDIFPDDALYEKYKEFYKNKYGLIIKTLTPENVQCDEADIKGSFTALNGINGNFYFTINELYGSTFGNNISGQIQELTPQSSIITGIASNLKPGEEYYYYLIYECVIDGLHFKFESENLTDFTTPTPSATTIGVQSTSDQNVTIRCSFKNVPDGALCGVEYWKDDASKKYMSALSSDGEQSINISGLEPNTTYYYNAVILYEGKTYMGAVKEVTTEPEKEPIEAADLYGTWCLNNSDYITLNEDGTIIWSPITDILNPPSWIVTNNEWHYSSDGNITISIAYTSYAWWGEIKTSYNFRGSVNDMYNPTNITGTVIECIDDPDNPDNVGNENANPQQNNYRFILTR